MKKPDSFHTVTIINAGKAVSRLPSQLGPARPNHCMTCAISPYCGV
ncbi:Uncharacterised protein [Bordetella pertussis]|nr:Uncharacterised protein [Bordetella pertussis]